MKLTLRIAMTASALLIAVSAGGTALAQQRGGVFTMFSLNSPPSMSIHEEATPASQAPMMGVFNNLVMFDQHVKQNSLQSIVPDLATGWSWNEDGTELTFPLRNGVKWHDGTPFTDVNGCGPRFMRAHSPGSRANVVRNAVAHSPRSRGRTMPFGDA